MAATFFFDRVAAIVCQVDGALASLLSIARMRALRCVCPLRQRPVGKFVGAGRAGSLSPAPAHRSGLGELEVGFLCVGKNSYSTIWDNEILSVIRTSTLARTY